MPVPWLMRLDPFVSQVEGGGGRSSAYQLTGSAGGVQSLGELLELSLAVELLESRTNVPWFDSERL